MERNGKVYTASVPSQVCRRPRCLDFFHRDAQGQGAEREGLYAARFPTLRESPLLAEGADRLLQGHTSRDLPLGLPASRALPC